jgi:glycosyltransferase involved in cell wall biosynthesis
MLKNRVRDYETRRAAQRRAPTTTDGLGVKSRRAEEGAIADQSQERTPARRRVLKVCHLGKFYPPASGGMETHARTLAQAQAALGAEVQVLCINHRDSDGRDVTWEPLIATETQEDQDGPVRVIRVGRQASLARFELCLRLPELLRSLARQGIDVLHLHTPNPTMVLSLAAARPKVPLVVTHHSDVVRQKRLGQILRPFETFVYRRAAALVATSPCYVEGSDLLRKFDSKLTVLPFGIDPTPFVSPSPAALAVSARLRAEHGQPLWLTVGRLVYYKGLATAVRALALVPGKLVVVGDGPLRRELQELAWRHEVADRIVWLPYLDDTDLVGAYHAATALWFPSNARSEAFGLVQVEAMASGCPVINTELAGSGVPWVSRHEESGLTVAVDDPGALAVAARRLLEEGGLRERLGKMGRERACGEFEKKVMAERSLELYERVVGAGPR